MNEHVDPTVGLDDPGFEEPPDLVPPVEDDPGWSPVMSVPPPAAEIPAIVDEPLPPHEAAPPPMPDALAVGATAPPPPVGGDMVDLGTAPPVPIADAGGLPPALDGPVDLGAPPMPPVDGDTDLEPPIAGSADAAAPPMPPVTGDTDLAPPIAGSTDASGEAPTEPPLLPDGPAAEAGNQSVIGTGQPDGETGPIGAPPMPPVDGDTDLEPPIAGTTDAGSATPTEPPVAPDVPAGAGGNQSVIGTGQPGGDLGTFNPDSGMFVRIDPETGADILHDPVTGLDYQVDLETGHAVHVDPVTGVETHIDAATGERTIADEEATTAGIAAQIETELNLPVERGQEQAVATALLDAIATEFPDIPEEARAALEASLADAGMDGDVRFADQLQALRDAGFGFGDSLPEGDGAAVATVCEHAAAAGRPVITVLDLGEGTDAFRVAVADGVVEFESVRGNSVYAVERASFERAFDSPGARVISSPTDPVASPVVDDLAATPAAAVEDEDGSSFGRNLLIGGAVLLPAAGAAAYFTTKKVR